MSSSFPERGGAAFRAATLLIATLPSGATAQTVPRLEVDASVFASDNPLLVTGDHTGAAQAELTLRPSLSYTSTRGSTASAETEITARQYSRRYGNFLLWRVQGDAVHRDSEFLSIGASASFARELAVDALGITPDATVAPRSIRTAIASSVFAAWRPSAVTTIRPEIAFERSSYGDTALLGTTRSISAGLGYARRISEITEVGVRATALWSDVGGAANLSTQSLRATVNRRLSDGWRLTAELGGEHTDTRLERWAGVAVTQRSRWMPGGAARLCWERAPVDACLGVRRATEVSALGGFQRRWSLDGSLDYTVSRDGSILASANYSRAGVQRDLLAELEAARAEAGYRHRLTSRLTLAGLVRYVRSTLIDGSHIDAGYAGLRLTLRPRVR